MSDSNILVRLATLDDVPTVASILKQAFLEFESLYVLEAFNATTPTSEQIQARFGEGPIWVAFKDEQIVGTVAGVLKSDGLYVRSMAVLPKARGYRIGQLLLNAAEEYAQSQSCKRMFLSTTPFLAGAIHLYASFGFQRTADGPHDLFGTPLFTMVKRL